MKYIKISKRKLKELIHNSFIAGKNDFNQFVFEDKLNDDLDIMFK